MKKMYFFLASAAMGLITLPADAQVGKTIPKLEFSAGVGAGLFGYTASIEKDSWFDRMNIENKEYFFSKYEDLPWGSAHGGLYVDYHFTDHWGLAFGRRAGNRRNPAGRRDLDSSGRIAIFGGCNNMRS